jgi:hypothetical protein
LYLMGLAMLGYGAIGLVTDPAGPRLGRYLLFALVLLLSHDLLLGPLALVAGAALARWVPAGVRGVVRAGLLATGTVTLVALPFVLGHGYRSTNPSALPLNYGHGLLITLGGIWLGAAAVALLQTILFRYRHRRKISGGRSGLPRC